MTNFRYHNVNPQNEVEQDCVTRAISLASGLSYKVVGNLLELVADKNNCDKLCVCCYHHLLEDILDYRVKYVKDNKTVEKIAKEYPNNVLIVRIDGHLTCCMYGVCFDIWDCTQEEVDCFWIVQ